MDRREQVAEIIREVCRREGLLADIPEDADFFDHGVSSLAVIQMQIRIEEALHVTVSTSDLMHQPTINGWIDLYARAASTPTEAGVSADPAYPV